MFTCLEAVDYRTVAGCWALPPKAVAGLIVPFRSCRRQWISPPLLEGKLQAGLPSLAGIRMFEKAAKKKMAFKNFKGMDADHRNIHGAC